MFRCLIAALFAALVPLTAVAQQVDSRILYQHRAWMVRIVKFADDSVWCAAQVSKPNSTFSIWADGRSPYQLEFFSNAWQLGTRQSDVVVRIDRRAPWNLYNANLNENSVLFTLPSDNDGYRFVREVMRGSTISLSNSRGIVVDSWSLSGSSRTISSLNECINRLQYVRPGLGGDPFR